MDNSYDIVIIGGGLMGCATAYYYQKVHPHHKVVILERNEICSAATSRAAALITIIRSKKEFIPLSIETYKAIEELESVLSDNLELKKVGVLHVARKDSAINDLNQLMEIAREYHQPCTWLSKSQTTQKVPWLHVTDHDGMAFFPNEAYCDPYLLGTFFARAAVKLGVKILKNVEVSDWYLQNGKISGVIADRDTFFADHFVLATGTWSPVLCRSLDIHPPMAPVRSQYWITERNIDLFPENSPIVILPDANAYTRPEGNSLLFGIREKKSFYVSPSLNPKEWHGYPFSPDKGMTDLENNIDRMVPFFPTIEEIGIQHYIAGFSGYTPDNYLTFGTHPKHENLSIMAGCVGAGISVCGGVGKSLAYLASGNKSPFDISSFSLQRYGDINCFDESWLQRCADARSIKESG